MQDCILEFLREKLKFSLKKDRPSRVAHRTTQKGTKDSSQTSPWSKSHVVIDFILSYKATESHYRRVRSGCKKYFDSNILMRQMWSEFVCEHPHLTTTSFKNKNKGPVISFSTFRNIFNRELKDVLSFRRFRVDTCQECDNCNNRLDNLQSLNNRSSKQDDKIRDLVTRRSLHLWESQVRFEIWCHSSSCKSVLSVVR